APILSLAAPAGKIAVCHATHSATNPFVRIEVGPTAAAVHLALHDGDYEPSAGAECGGTSLSACGDSAAGAARSCRAILDDCGPHPDGVYWIDPSGAGTPFRVYCDMTRNGGGWMLVGKVGEGRNPDSDFRTDVDLPALLLPVPAPTEYAHFDHARFDAY